jgi:acetoin utilization deacetylase AcuC-like enzyme
MLIVLTLAGGYAAWRVASAALATWRRLPRSNDDLVFF